MLNVSCVEEGKLEGDVHAGRKADAHHDTD